MRGARDDTSTAKHRFFGSPQIISTMALGGAARLTPRHETRARLERKFAKAKHDTSIVIATILQSPWADLDKTVGQRRPSSRLRKSEPVAVEFR